MNNIKKHLNGTLGFFIIMGLFGLLFVVAIDRSHTNQIEEKIESVGGEPVFIDGKSLFQDDPFKWYEHGKGTTIYKFTYILNGEEKHGWVMFGHWKPIWIMNGEREK